MSRPKLHPRLICLVCVLRNRSAEGGIRTFQSRAPLHIKSTHSRRTNMGHSEAQSSAKSPLMPHEQDMNCSSKRRLKTIDASRAMAVHPTCVPSARFHHQRLSVAPSQDKPFGLKPTTGTYSLAYSRSNQQIVISQPQIPVMRDPPASATVASETTGLKGLDPAYDSI